MRRGLRRTFFRPERPTLTSRSLQSIARPFQKRFREVFGNARILIFYLSIKDWEEKSLPRSHLGWFFLVFGEGKATKENMSIFWFIWPLKCGVWQIISMRIKKSVCLNFNKTQINFKTYIFNSRDKKIIFLSSKFWGISLFAILETNFHSKSNSVVQTLFFIYLTDGSIEFFKISKRNLHGVHNNVSIKLSLTWIHCNILPSNSKQKPLVWGYANFFKIMRDTYHHG